MARCPHVARGGPGGMATRRAVSTRRAWRRGLHGHSRRGVPRLKAWADNCVNGCAVKILKSTIGLFEPENDNFQLFLAELNDFHIK